MLNPCSSAPDKVIITNTIGMSFSKFFRTIKDIIDAVGLTSDIDDKMVNIRFHNESISHLSLSSISVILRNYNHII